MCMQLGLGRLQSAHDTTRRPRPRDRAPGAPRGPAGDPSPARVPARVHPRRPPAAGHEAVAGGAGVPARGEPHAPARGAADAPGRGLRRVRAQPADARGRPRPGGARRRLRLPDRARDAGAVDDAGIDRLAPAPGGAPAAHRDAPGGADRRLPGVVRRAPRLPPGADGRGGEPFLRQLQSLEDRSVRYIRIYQQSEPAGWQTAGDVEHAAILDALAAGDDHAALSGLAHHLARTALRVLSDCAPGYTPRAVPHAVALAEGADPAALRAASAG